MNKKMLFVLNITLFISMQSCLSMEVDTEKTDTKEEKPGKVRLSRTRKNTIYFRDTNGGGTRLRMQLADYSPTGESRIVAPKESGISTEENKIVSVHNLSKNEQPEHAFALVTDDNRLGIYYRQSAEDTAKPIFTRKASVSCFIPFIKKIKHKHPWVFAKYDSGEAQKGYNAPENVRDKYKIAVAMLKKEPIGRIVRPIIEYKYTLSDFKIIPNAHRLSAVCKTKSHNIDDGIEVTNQDKHKTTIYTIKDFEASGPILKKRSRKGLISLSESKRSSKNIL